MRKLFAHQPGAGRVVGVMLIAGFVCSSGCTEVDPSKDYQRTAERIRSRVGVADVFDPTIEDSIAQKVDALLADGITIDEATQIALLNNRDFQVRFREIGVSRAEVVQSALLSNPTIALGFNFPEGGGVVDFTLSIAQQIADLWQIPIRKRIAEAQLERTILEAGRAAVELTGRVRSQCYQVLALQRASRLAEDSVNLAQRIVDVSERLVEAGQANSFDANLTRATLLDNRANWIATQGDLEVAYTQLADSLGLSRRNPSLYLTGELPEPRVTPADWGELLLVALDQRMDARAAALDVQAAEDELAKQYRRVFPDVQLGLALERNERRALPGRKILSDTAQASVAAGKLTAPSIQSRGQRRLAESQIIDAKLGPSLAVTLPIWDQNQAQIAKARFRAVQTRTKYEQILDSIAVDIEQAASRSQTAAALFRLYRDESVPLADETVKGATQLYAAGERDVLVLVEAQEKLVQRRRDLVQALRDYAVGIADLESAVGGKLPAPAATSQPAGEGVDNDDHP